MNRKKLIVLIIIIVVIAVICMIGYFICIKNNYIKEGDIFNNVSFKNDIPKINYKDYASINIFDSDNNIYYYITYIGNVTNKGTEGISFIVEDGKNKKRYNYSWDSFDVPATTIATPKGWSVVKTDGKWQEYLMPIQELPINSINGIVVNTSGNTSIFKNFLTGL